MRVSSDAVQRYGGDHASAERLRTSVGAAAINTLSQIGAFVTPYAWGAAKDATGSFQTGLNALVVMTLVLAGLILTLRRQVRGRQPAVAIASPG